MDRRLFAAVSIAALAWSASAAAQAEQPPGSAQSSASAAAPQQADASDGELGEIVVTAERRNTSLQRTGVAATVLTGEDLERKNVLSVDDLQFAAPSLTVQNFGQGNQVNVRGVGKATGGAAINVGVVTYRDGVAIFPGYFQSEPYYDIASVEVLRGPQGTFVGQNATGGAIFITSRDPQFDGVHGYGQVQISNYDNVRTQGALNVPVSDTLAVRLAFNREVRDSFYDIAGGYGGHPGRLEGNSVRGSLLWEPTDQVRILLKGDYNNIDKGGYAADLATDTGNPFEVANNAAINEGQDDFGRIVLNASYTTGGGVEIRSISGFQKGTSAAVGDLDATIPGSSAPAAVAAASTIYNFISDERILSQEINVISPDTGPFTWILGAYYQHDKGTYPDGRFFTRNALGTVNFTEGLSIKSNTAGFAQVGYEIADGLQIEGGVRYSRSTFENIGRLRSVTAAGATVIFPTDSKYDDDAVTGKVALNWQASRDHFFYAFVATGYKSGGLNVASRTPATQSFEPEHVTDYEIGWKGTFLDGRLRTQLGGYYNRYKDFQVRIADPELPQTSPFQNIPSATTLAGVEASAQASFGPLGIDLGIGYLHSEFGQFFAADPRLRPTGSCDPLTGPASPTCTDLTGRRTPYAPEFTGNVGVQYALALGGGVTLTPRVDYAHISESFGTLFQDEARGDRLVPRDIFNAQLTLDVDRLSVTGYITNATDLTYVAATNGNFRYAAPPRQYGVRITGRF
ncbi:TonB-dependent receptor [Pelagerythrobacter sp.]|uniref:TonB-dependent receptor n=1 Tax=Pelagerythrobacter sp. TaxID=2800702 RepID=UPI0035AE9138